MNDVVEGFYSANAMPNLCLPSINGKKMQFKHGTLKLTDAVDIAAMDAELEKNAALRSRVQKIDIAALEAISKAHQAKSQRPQAFSGAFTSDAMLNKSSEILEHKEAQAVGVQAAEAAIAGALKEAASSPDFKVTETVKQERPTTPYSPGLRIGKPDKKSGE